MSLFFRQWRNELLKLCARRRTYLGLVGSVVAELIFLVLWKQPLAQRAFEKAVRGGVVEPNVFWDQYFHGLTMGLLMLTFSFLLLGGLYLALVAGDIVAKEAEEGTLSMILSRPISRLRLWSLKWLTCSVYTFGLVCFMGLSSLLLASVFCGGLGKLAVVYGQHPRHLQLVALFETAEGLWRYGRGVLLLGVVMHVVSALAFMFSCFNLKPATAAIATLAVFFIDAVLKVVPFFIVFEKWLISYHLACWLRSFAKYEPAVDVGTSAGYLLALSGIFLGVGAVQFCRRDFKP